MRRVCVCINNIILTFFGKIITKRRRHTDDAKFFILTRTDLGKYTATPSAPPPPTARIDKRSCAAVSS